jgi:tetraacyldisaccharide 4'-kinase
MLFITAISKPQRLEAYLPEGMQKVYFPDHYHFSQEELQALLTKHQKKEILTTSKDAVKMQDFGIHLSLIRLSIMIESDIHQIVDDFIENFGKISKN